MGGSCKLTSEERVSIVETYLAGEIGYAAAYETAEIGGTTLRRWVNQYKMEGPTGLLPRRQKQHYTKAIKQAAVTDYLDGQGSLKDICNKYGIRHSRQLENWIKMYNSHEEFRV